MSTEEKEEKKVNKIMYIGGDASFFQAVCEKFKEAVTTGDVEFDHLNSNDEKIIQSYILKIREEKPKLILIDFSQNEKAMLHLTRLWLRQNFYVDIPIIGVCDYNQSKSIIVKAVMTSLNAIYVKSSEIEFLLYGMVTFAFPNKVEMHDFATAKMEDTIHAFYPCKASMINENFIRLESNIQMSPKQVVRINNFWTRQQTIRSNMFMCADQSQVNLYYNFRYKQVFQMAHVDPVQQTENMTREEFDEAQEKRAELIEESRYKMKKWVGDNIYNSKPKFLKAYVIDKEGIFFENKPMSDTYSFVYRNQPFMMNPQKELNNIKPQLIIYNLEHISKEELEANTDIAHTFNDSRMLNHLIRTIRQEYQGTPPIIIVFNSGKHDTPYLQKVFNYQNILAVKEKMNLELVLKMSEMLKTKIEPSLPQPNKTDIYLDKSSDVTYCEIESEITLIACSENDLYFNSLEEIKEGTVLRISLPVPMYITVAPIPEKTKIQSQYYALINGIGEEERKELRRYINSVFFRDLENQKSEDAEKVEALKKQYLDKQNAAEKEAQEREAEAAKKEKELEDKAKGLVDQLD